MVTPHVAYNDLRVLTFYRPKPFQGLKKKSKSDAETTLTNRLIEAGAPFKGPFPSPREVRQAEW